MKQHAGDYFTDTELGMIAKGLGTQAKVLLRYARSRKFAGPAFTEKRAELRRLAGRYAALAREIEEEII